MGEKSIKPRRKLGLITVKNRLMNCKKRWASLLYHNIRGDLKSLPFIFLKKNGIIFIEIGIGE